MFARTLLAALFLAASSGVVAAEALPPAPADAPAMAPHHHKSHHKNHHKKPAPDGSGDHTMKDPPPPPRPVGG